AAELRLDGLAVRREAEPHHERVAPVEAGIRPDRRRGGAVVPLARIEAVGTPPHAFLDEEVLALLVRRVAARVEDRPLARAGRVERRDLLRRDAGVERADLRDRLADLQLLPRVERED